MLTISKLTEYLDKLVSNTKEPGLFMNGREVRQMLGKATYEKVRPFLQGRYEGNSDSENPIYFKPQVLQAAQDYWDSLKTTRRVIEPTPVKESEGHSLIPEI